MLVEKINMKKLNYTEDLLRVIFFWIGIFFLVSGVLSFLGILKPAVNSGIQNPDMLGTVFSITGVQSFVPKVKASTLDKAKSDNSSLF